MTAPFLPYGRQWISDEDVSAIARAVRDPYLTTGPGVAAFETSLKAAAGTEHAVAVNSGTAALHVAYHALGLGQGDRIVTTPLTFAATANAALYLGASVTFADVEPDTGNLSVKSARDALEALGPAEGKRTLLVGVDFTGAPADYENLRPIADQYGAGLVADAAHSIGATISGRPAQQFVDAATFSFHPVKTITTAEGGAVVTSSGAVAERAFDFRNHGLVRDRERMHADEGPWFYEQHCLGFNYRLSDLQCALGVSQMSRLSSFVQRRREIASRYTEALKDVKEITLPTVRRGSESAFHLYVIRVNDPSRRKAFFERLQALNLGVQVHYIPVYFHPYYQELGHKRGLCPVAEDFYARCVSIPMYPQLTDSDVDSAAERIRQAVKDVL